MQRYTVPLDYAVRKEETLLAIVADGAGGAGANKGFAMEPLRRQRPRKNRELRN